MRKTALVSRNENTEVSGKQNKNRGRETLIAVFPTCDKVGKPFWKTSVDKGDLHLCFSQAEVIIHVTHGQGHLLYTELTQLLDQCTAELWS